MTGHMSHCEGDKGKVMKLPLRDNIWKVTKETTIERQQILKKTDFDVVLPVILKQFLADTSLGLLDHK